MRHAFRTGALRHLRLPLWFFLAVAIVAVVTRAEARTTAVKPSLNSYFPQDFKDMAYQKSCLDSVLKTWAIRGGAPRAGTKTVVQSTIARDGKLIDARVILKSGSDSWDSAALAAVRKASPFPAFPKSHSGSQIEVHWHFANNR